MKARHTATLLGVVVLLSGCTAIGPTAAERTPSTGPSANASETSLPTQTPAQTAATMPAATSEAAPEATASWQEAVVANQPVDSGPVEHAQGTVAVNDAGVPVEYSVASDDNAGAICNRLGVRWWQLEDASGELLGTYPTLYPGDVITIVATDSVIDKREANNALC